MFVSVPLVKPSLPTRPSAPILASLAISGGRSLFFFLVLRSPSVTPNAVPLALTKMLPASASVPTNSLLSARTVNHVSTDALMVTGVALSAAVPMPRRLLASVW